MLPRHKSRKHGDKKNGIEKKVSGDEDVQLDRYLEDGQRQKRALQQAFAENMETTGW